VNFPMHHYCTLLRRLSLPLGLGAALAVAINPAVGLATAAAAWLAAARFDRR